MRVDQVVVGAAPGDAITNAALENRRLLRQGLPSDIYARHIHPDLAGDVHPLDAYRGRPGGSAGDVLLHHASIGEPEVHRFILERHERVVLVYHNITPAEWFAPWDPSFAAALAAGRRELVDLRDRVVAAFADSAFNASELLELGYDDVRVVPLVIDVERLLSVEPLPEAINHLDVMVSGPIVLAVGQLLPHKRIDLLLQAYHVLITHLVPEANLVLVGPSRLPPYHSALRHLVEELNLHRAWFTGAISEAELVALFRRADLYVTASDHEGFCVPLLEAMAFDLPIVARGCGAIPETLGGAGLCLPPDAGPILVAEAITEVLGDAHLAASLVEGGRRRRRDFAPDVARAGFLEQVASIL